MVDLRSSGESSSLGLRFGNLGLLATPSLTLDLQLSKAFEKAAANGLGGDFASAMLVARMIFWTSFLRRASDIF